MEFKKSSKVFTANKPVHISDEVGALKSAYPHALQLYALPPNYIIDLPELENYVVERLKVLRLVERVGVKQHWGSNKYREELVNELRKNKLKPYQFRDVFDADLTEDILNERKKDHISHFLLRLAYCKTEELRKWFIEQELNLFRFRFRNEPAASIQKFNKINQLDYVSLDSEEKEAVTPFLLMGSYGGTIETVKGETYYKVPFMDVTELVGNRSCFLRDGYAYIKLKDLVYVISSQFRTRLSKDLALTARALPYLEEDNRLLKLLSNLHSRYVGSSYKRHNQDGSAFDSSGTVTAEMIDPLSKYFPPCMKAMRDNLSTKHHLKHVGRLQYGLFLKGIGLTVDESLKYWKGELCRGKVDLAKFDKDYAYNIKYNYGQVGQRKNWTPKNCMSIIMNNPPGAGDCHGCPFKHSDMVNLNKLLKSYGNRAFDSNSFEQIRSFVEQGHFQVACSHFFQVTHGNKPPKDAINFPNQFFEESRRLTDGGNYQANSNLPQTASQSAAVEAKKGDEADISNSQIDADDFDGVLSAYQEEPMDTTA